MDSQVGRALLENTGLGGVASSNTLDAEGVDNQVPGGAQAGPYI